jgi:uncharacterized protein YraI
MFKILLALIMLLAMLNVSPMTTQAATPQNEMVAYINQLRAKVGVAPLRESCILNASAQMKSADIASGWFKVDHSSSNGYFAEQWKVSAGYPPSSPGWGENILWGAGSVYEAFKIWEGSSAHYQNMVSPNYTEVGVGIASGVYWGAYTLHFGNATTASCGSYSTPAPPSSTGNAKTTSSVNLRSAPSLSGSILMVLPANATITTLGPTKVADGYTWMNVSYSGTVGWVASTYVSTGSTVPNPVTPVPTPVPTRTPTPVTPVATVPPSGTLYTTTSINFRATPSLSGTIIRSLPAGTAYTRLGPTQNADGYTWLNVLVQGQSGWIAGSTAAPVATPTRTPIPVTSVPTVVSGTVTNTDANLRSQPTTQSTILTVLAPGTPVTVIGGSVYADGYTWTQISARGYQGWIVASFLS